MKENCHREKNCESEVKTEPTEEIISGNVKCEIDEEGQGSNFDFSKFLFLEKKIFDLFVNF